MADDVAEPQDAEAVEPEEPQAPPQGEGAYGPTPRLPVRRVARLFIASFLLCGLLGLIAGGHFQRPPLNNLRHVPLLGRLIPAPRGDEEPPPVPSVAVLHPMPATEFSELVQELQKAREGFKARGERLAQQEERLRALQLDLVKERDQLDERMKSLFEYHAELEEMRQALEAGVVIVRSEEKKRLTQLARIYEAQEPARAAAELAALNQSAQEDLAVKILAAMTEKKAAPIFNEMNPEDAAALKAKLVKLRYEREKKEESS